MSAAGHSLLCRMDLPGEARDPTLWKGVGALGRALHYYSGVLARFQELWAELDALDVRTRVIFPSRPRRSDVVRRIHLRPGLSVQIAVNAEAPRQAPEQCVFFGPGAEASQARYHQQTRPGGAWDPRVSLVDNLSRVLDHPLPPPVDPENADAAAAEVQCGICYCFLLEEVSSLATPSGTPLSPGPHAFILRSP